MKRLFAAAILTLFALIGQAHAAATLLPSGENCFQATTGVTGMVGALGTITGGSGGTAGTYAGVALTGGSGSGATANIVVSGGAVTQVTILNPGIQYVVADVLGAASGSIGNVSGFSVPVNSVAINSSLAGGKVYFYVPNTTTFKQTWSNAAQTVQNTNPVQLDQNGCAIIYGTGTYRQILQDSLGDTVWDQVTADTSANNSTFWAGLSGGTPNVITVTDAGFNATDGSVINFTALSTNTSSATLNPSGYGAIPILKDTTGGPVALTGGEIVQNNPVSVIFRAVDNAFHILNPPIQSASGATAPLCGASGLKITNSVGTPNTVLTITARQAVMQTNAGLVINRSTVSQNINITLGTAISAAGGMDGEALPASTAGWLDIWLIDNGAAPAGLASLAAGNGQAPTMPSGYSYKCYLGAMRFDTSGNLLRTLQVGNETQYTVIASGSLPTIASGAAAFWTAEPIAAFVPPTATRIRAILQGTITGATQTFGLAPNLNYGTAPNSAQVPPCAALTNNTGTTGTNQVCDLTIESANIYYGAVGTSGSGAYALGWKDAINAN